MSNIETAKSNAAPAALYMTIANHWSYVGIGWQSGLESCAQSLCDSMAMADYEPSVKTCVNMDAGAFELLAEHYPEVIARFRRYVQAGKVEVVGGSYGQPMGSMNSGESNLRQMTYGQQAVQLSLGVPIDTFLEEEEFSHPQIPQLAKLAGYQFASQAQCDTWGQHGNPPRTDSVFQWKGIDGTVIPATDLRYDKANLILENEYLRLRVDPVGGGVVSLVDKRSGLECIQASQPFPTLHGENDHSGAGGFDSRKTEVAIVWLEEGPVRATVSCSLALPGVRMETRISLAAGAAHADVAVRLIADDHPGGGGIYPTPRVANQVCEVVISKGAVEVC